MFNTPVVYTTVQQSIAFLNFSIRDSSDLAYINNDNNQSNEDKEREKNFEILLYLDTHQRKTVDTVRQASYFETYFQIFFNSHLQIVSKYDQKIKSISPNYAPKLVEIIMKYDYVMPLWSGIVLNKNTPYKLIKKQEANYK